MIYIRAKQYGLKQEVPKALISHKLVLKPHTKKTLDQLLLIPLWRRKKVIQVDKGDNNDKRRRIQWRPLFKYCLFNTEVTAKQIGSFTVERCNPIA